MPWGRDLNEGETVEQVVFLKPVEEVDIDRNRLAELYNQLGYPNAEDVICRAMEEIAVRLAHADRTFKQGPLDEMKKSVRSLKAIAAQIGLETLTQVAGDVYLCIETGDMAALAATKSRLTRTGEISLVEIWDLQDLSV